MELHTWLIRSYEKHFLYTRGYSPHASGRQPAAGMWRWNAGEYWEGVYTWCHRSFPEWHPPILPLYLHSHKVSQC